MSYATPSPASKIFGVGFNKTGTSTLGKCFDILSIGPVARPQALHDRLQGEQYRDYARSPLAAVSEKASSAVTGTPFQSFGVYPYRVLCDEVFDQRNYGLAIQIAANFRAFHDRPWNVGELYRALDVTYPGSRFILTWREPEAWWRSVENWLTISHPEDGAKYTRYLKHIGTDVLDKDRFITRYLDHNASIRAYFGNRPDFLDINFEQGDDWQRLCNFLCVPIPERPFPHENRQQYEV